jgi:hypothetical protein
MERLPFNHKVFGVGLGRTGTASLSMALNLLGIKTIHFLDYKLHLTDYKVNVNGFWGDRLYDKLSQFQGIANGTGLPFRELDQTFPGSKFILTVREKNAWIGSKRQYAKFESENWQRLDSESKNAKRFIRENVYGTFDFDETSWFDAYEQHVKNVLNYFNNRLGDLFMMDIPGGDGWEKLCPFLGLRLPSEPFPHTNSSQAVSTWIKMIASVCKKLEMTILSSSDFILVDECKLGFISNRALPFLEHDGNYWGLPSDSKTAIYELNRMRRNGANFIVFVWQTFWWLDHYVEFNKYLRSRFSCKLENEQIIVFDMRLAPSPSISMGK